MSVDLKLSNVRMTTVNRCQSVHEEPPRTWRCQLVDNHSEEWHMSLSGHRKVEGRAMTWNQDGTAIDYFDDGGEHEFLSNFYPSPIVWTSMQGFTAGGFEAPTVEHAFQAEKASNPTDYVNVLTASTPGLAKRLGRTCLLRSDWEAVKFVVMHKALRLKFAPGSELAERLLATGDAPLIEGNVWHDQVWGTCLCDRHRAHKGQNHLGLTLMQVREELRHA